MLTLLAAAAVLSSQPLTIGDMAPPLVYGHEVKGRPVHTVGDGRVTVVEFWATWCKPCIDFMPHLSDLWRKHKARVDFVSVSVWDDAEAVPGFVRGMGDKMAYPVVTDRLDKSGNGIMAATWLEAAGQAAIPVAFVIDGRGRIAWLGHPQNLESVLDQVLMGRWDVAAYRAKFEAKQDDAQASARLMAGAYGRLSSTVMTHSYESTLQWIRQNGSQYNGVEAQEALSDLAGVFSAFERGSFADALALAKAEPTNGLVWTYFRPMLLVAQIDALQALDEEWRTTFRQALNLPPDPNRLMTLVDAMTLPESKLREKDPALALEAAEQLAGLARAPMFLLRLGWAQYASGDREQALKTIEEALAGMEAEKERNPSSYESLLSRLEKARRVFGGEKAAVSASVMLMHSFGFS